MLIAPASCTPPAGPDQSRRIRGRKGPMFITHSYLGTTRGPYRCLFFLLLEDYIEAQTQFVRDLDLDLERFARRFGDTGAVVRPFIGDIESTRQQVLGKRWSDRQRSEIYKTPSL